MYRHALYLSKDDVQMYSFDLDLGFRLKVGDHISAECLQHEALLRESVMDSTDQLDHFFYSFDRFMVTSVLIEGPHDLTVGIIPVLCTTDIAKKN